MKKRIWEKRIFSFVTALALCLCLLPGKMVYAIERNVSTWDEFMAALNESQVTTIYLMNAITSPKNDDVATEKFVINREVTIQNRDGVTKPLLDLAHMGVQLEANVTFKGISINLSNKHVQAMFTNGSTLTLEDVSFVQRTDIYTKGLTIKKIVIPKPEPPVDGGDTTRSARAGSGNTINFKNVTGINMIYGGAAVETITLDEAVDIGNGNPTYEFERTEMQTIDSNSRIVFDNSGSTPVIMGFSQIANLDVNSGTLQLSNANEGFNVQLAKKAALNVGTIHLFDTGKFNIGAFNSEGGTLFLGAKQTLAMATAQGKDTILKISGNGSVENEQKYIEVAADHTIRFVFDPLVKPGNVSTKKDQNCWYAVTGIPSATIKAVEGTLSKSGWYLQPVDLLAPDNANYRIAPTDDQFTDNPDQQQRAFTTQGDAGGTYFYCLKDTTKDQIYYKAIALQQDVTPPVIDKVDVNPQTVQITVTLTIPPEEDTSGILNYTLQDKALGNDKLRDIVSTTNVITLPNLRVGKTYNFAVIVTDVAGNQSVEKIVSITPEAVRGGNLSDGLVKFTSTEFYYNSNEQQPYSVGVQLNGGDVPTDAYELTYVNSSTGNDDRTNAGTITVTATAKAGSGFTGSVSGVYYIYPAPLKVEPIPTASSIRYGQRLSESTFAGGDVRVTGGSILDGNMVDGTWTWKDQYSQPLGPGNQTAVFTPTESNYETVEMSIPLTVEADTPNIQLTAPSGQVAGYPVTVSVVISNKYDPTLANLPTATLSYKIGNGTVQSLPGGGGTFTIPANTPADTKITITAKTGTVNGQYLAAEKTATITVTNKTEVRIRDVDPDDAIYDGKPHVGYVGEPMVRRGYEGEFDIKYAGRDGTTYNSNVPPTNAGDYTVTFSVPDSDPTYRGSLTLEFTIEKREVTVRPRSLTVKLGSKAPTLELEFDNIADGENDLTPSAAPVFEITAEDATITDLKDVPNRDGVYDVKWRNINASTFRNSNNYEITKRGSGTITVKETVGWEILRKGSRYYTDVDEYLTGWQVMNNRQYYFDEAGYMATGWYQDEDMNWYLFSETGVMQTGWKQVGGRWYNMKSNGPMRTGWYCDNENRWYMLNRGSGAMQTGWVRDSNGAWYYCNSAGVMQTGWTYASGRWYNMRSDGVMRTGWYSDGRNWYYLGSDGAMRTGWNQIAGSWYYMGSDGRMYVNTRTPDGYRVNASGRMIGR